MSHAVTIEQLNHQVQRMNKRLAEQDQRFRINGYATFGIAQSDEAVSYNNVSDEVDFRRFARAGIQMTFNVNKQSSVVTQLVSRGENDFNTNMEWAYYRHQFNSEWSGKIGRIRAPYYMLSEYLDVGYAVPWAQMPAETYSQLSTFANVDGIDLTWDTEVAEYGLQVQGIYGKTTTDDFIVKDLYSVGVTLLSDEWSIRMATAGANLTANTGVQGQIVLAGDSLYGNGSGSQAGSFASLSFRYDPGDMLVMGEYTASEVDGVLADQSSIFMTFGYRFNQWMPHITYSFHESDDNSDRVLPTSIPSGTDLTSSEVPTGTIPDLNGNGTSNEAGDLAALLNASNNAEAIRIGLGVRYDLSAGVALKLQYDMVDASDVGLYDFQNYLAAQGAGKAPDKVNILTFTIDTVF